MRDESQHGESATGLMSVVRSRGWTLLGDRRITLAMVAFVTAIAGVRILAVWMGWLDSEGTLADDAFYYFQIGRHMAMGQGPTFDGLAPTNGFHPLYLVLLTALYKLVPADPWIPIHLAQTAGVLFDLLSTIVIGLLVYRQGGGGPATSVLAILLWSSNPLVVATSHRGLESSLSTLLALVSVLAFRSLILAPTRSVRPSVVAGGIFGLSLLSRTENILLIVPIIGTWFVLRLRWRAAAVMAGVLTLVVMPWVVWQWTTFHTIAQASGEATRLFRIYGHLDFGGASPWNPATLLDQVSGVYARLVRCGLAQEFTPLHFFGQVYVGFNSLLLAVAVLGMATFLRGLSRSTVVLLPLLIYAVLHVAYYYAVAHTYRPWYHLTLVATAVVFGSLWAPHWLLGRRRLAVLAVSATLGLQLAALAVFGVHAAQFPTSRTFDKRIQWLKKNCGPRARIGMMNAGKLAYLAGFSSKLTIVNLDGVVNNPLLDAYRSGRIAEYYCRSVDYALEIPAATMFLQPEAQAEYLRFFDEHLEQVPTKPVPLYRIHCESRPGP